ncbi:hypothetical protein BDF22DRAFT_693920 [Syncephalis plumigaleata]|nr:hypothetical protein BDF22DRAFT_693920 [Syncephalis plumigaleata]
MALNIAPLVLLCIYAILLALPICYFYRRKKSYAYFLLALVILARITASVVVLYTDISASHLVNPESELNPVTTNATIRSNATDSLSTVNMILKDAKHNDDLPLEILPPTTKTTNPTMTDSDIVVPSNRPPAPTRLLARQLNDRMDSDIPIVPPPRQTIRTLTFQPASKPTATPTNNSNSDKVIIDTAARIIPMVEWSDAIHQLSTTLLVILNLLLLRWWALSTEDALSRRLYISAKNLYYAALPFALTGTILYVGGTALLLHKLALVSSKGSIDDVHTLDVALMQIIGTWLITLCLLAGLAIAVWTIIDYSHAWAMRGDIVERKRLQIKILMANTVGLLPIVGYHLMVAHIDPAHNFMTVDIRIILPALLALLPTAGWCWPGIIFNFQTGDAANIIGK